MYIDVSLLFCIVWDIVFISVREYHRGLTEWTRYNYYATLINHEGSIYIYKTCRKRMLSQCQMSVENVNMMCLLTDAGIRNLIGIFEEGTVISRKQLFSLSGWGFGKQFSPSPIYKWERSNITQTRSSMTCKKFSLGKQVNIHQCTVNVSRGFIRVCWLYDKVK